MSELTQTSKYLCEAVDSAAEIIEQISDQLDNACALVTQSLLSDGKLVICGNGYTAPMAGLLTTCLMHQQEFERPSLPAINISIDATTISAIARDGNYHNVYSKQLRAIGNSGDVLIALSTDGNCGNIVQAIQTAHEKNIDVVTIVGSQGGKISAVKQGKDVEICLHTTGVARTIEAQLFAINAMCHQIENHLFGSF